MNMIGSSNGQLHLEREQPKPMGRFTGERLLRERPRVYRKVVELLAEPGMSINQITKFCRVQSIPRYRALRGPIAGEAVVTLATPEYPFRLHVASLTRTR